jgi:hypothetical protein
MSTLAMQRIIERARREVDQIRELVDGLGLAIVKRIVTAAGGLEIRATFRAG